MYVHHAFILLLLAAAAFNAAESKHAKKIPGLTRASFPKGFVFGTAASAYQVEDMAKKDGRGPSIWDVFVNIPGNIANNAKADITMDEYHRYKKEEATLAKQLNLTPKQVEVWFQNRRARTKLKQTKVECKYLKRWCKKLFFVS